MTQSRRQDRNLMVNQKKERLCLVKKNLQSLGITVSPYGNALWLHGVGVSYVVSDLLGVRDEWLVPFCRTGRIEPECDENRPL